MLSHDGWQVPSPQNVKPVGHEAAKVDGHKFWFVTQSKGHTTLLWANKGHFCPYLS